MRNIKKQNLMNLAMIFISIIFLFFSNLARGQEAFICIPTARTGFAVNDATKKWEITKFTIDEDKKILKKINAKWEWRKFGDKWGYSECTNGGDKNSKDGFNSAGFIFCKVLGGNMRMSKNSLRYVETFEIGFTDGKDKNDNTPMIEMGTCSPL